MQPLSPRSAPSLGSLSKGPFERCLLNWAERSVHQEWAHVARGSGKQGGGKRDPKRRKRRRRREGMEGEEEEEEEDWGGAWLDVARPCKGPLCWGC